MIKRVFSLFLACAFAASTVACTPQQKLAVVQDIQKFIPAVTNVADAVCAFQQSNPICLTAVASTTASANLLTTALVNYYTAQASGTVPPGIIAALSTAIATFEADSKDILDAVHVLDPAKQQQIEALVAAAGVLLAIIETLLPPTVTSVVHLKFAASKPISQFSLASWTADYNAKVKECNKWMPKSKQLKTIHVHSTTLRVLSVGLAK